MKRCPKCDQTYNDGTLKFCLLDGTQLIETDSEPTVVIPKGRETSPPTVVVQRASKGTAVMWGVAAGMLVLLIGSVAAAFLAYTFWGSGANPRNDRPSAINTQTSKGSSTDPSRARSPEGAPVQAETPSEPPASPELGRDEVTPIAWSTAAVTFKGETGKTYTFACPENGTAGIIWGSDVYTADSSICTAAVHAGIITLENGGEVTMEFRPGRQTYGSTVRNGISSISFGEYGRSFVVRRPSGLSKPAA
ncbi:MAG TPA: LCCL domain-containing protein [Pyrinomonadaceae bacterium]|nr:LCCL domain-containing protein [Pyrinomonadaceae bacterium]